jgi:PAS domain S-box-containing protein
MSQLSGLLEFLMENSIYIISVQTAFILFLLVRIAFFKKKRVPSTLDQSPGLLNLMYSVSDADPVRILEINPDGLILSSNFYPAGSPRTLVGVNIRELFDDSLIKQRMANIQLAFMKNKVIKTSLTFHNRIFSSTIIPIFKNGSPERVLVISNDVTASTKRDITFQESVNQFKTVTHTLPGTIFRIDLQRTANTLVFISDQIEDLTGHPADDFLTSGLSFYSLMIPEDFNRVTRLLSKNTGTEEIDIEYRITHASGEIRWVLHKARITTDQDGKPKWKDGILLDITRQRKTEEDRDLAYQIIDNISLLHSTLTTEKSKTEIFIRALGQLKELTKSSFSGIGEVIQDVDHAQLKSWIVCHDAYSEKLHGGETGHHVSKNDELNQWISEILKTSDILLIKKEPGTASSSFDLQTFMGLPVKSGKTLVAVVWLANKDGGYGAYDVKLLKPILKTLGVMLGNLREQQRRRKTEHKVLDLNLALKQFKFALNHTSIVSITDLEGKIKYANQKFSRISQYSRNELIGKNHRIVNSSYHEKGFWRDMWETIHAGNLWRGEVQNRAKDGSYYWVDTFIVPILDSQRKIIEFMSIRNDITQKKQHESELKVLSLVARETSNYVLIADASCKIKWVNKSFENGMGYSLPELEGRDVVKLLELDKNNPALLTFINNFDNEQRTFTSEFPVHAKDGQLLWLQMNCQPIHDEKGLTTGYFALLQNISEQKKLIASLEDARQKAEESDRLKSSFLANVSHEIRTPMNAIMGFSELLQRPGLEDSKRNEFTKLIRQSSQELLTIVNDILDISKIEAGQMSSDFNVGNVQQVIDQLAAHYAAQIQWIHNKPIEIITFNNLPLQQNTIRADFNHLQQVLNNLISNAIKFTNQGVIEFGCTPGIGNMLVFSVRDTGIGISQEYHDLIFKPFRQLNTSQHLKIGGTGLGLAIAKGLVTLWGGEISVSSDGQNGTKFSFTIPYLSY